MRVVEPGWHGSCRGAQDDGQTSLLGGQDYLVKQSEVEHTVCWLQLPPEELSHP
eukprot:CAMPEP_0118987460 /NCGR_PEP_ID=MMETSP1173-20130426/44230_1 /TAXON_ID=1034831 /ORGANISM="Rhizochromulina marina cf, Strain CCMP1243" /LENGTH=53 /DNA_ID=CAMNT_0006938311 /DNA_START=111 /DNA_END=268 /DNA_ORIENTATION=+